MTLSLAELHELVEEWGFPRYRANQLFDWVHKKHASSYEEMSNLPKMFRERLVEEFPLGNSSIVNTAHSSDGTRKYVTELNDGLLVESVGMPVFNNEGDIERLTVCISSQVGCAMGCSFCATGMEGFSRNLTPAEIVQEVVDVQQDFGKRVSNVVVMGQGEPFLNYDNVIAALRLINSSDDLNIASRRITISTCGILDGIRKLEHEPEQFTLALSLHSAIQDKRDSLMPRVANQRLSDLKEALLSYCCTTNRRVTIEYLLAKGFNDGTDDLKALLKFTNNLLCHVNLLPVNKVDGSILSPSSNKTMKTWKDTLVRHGVETSVRQPRGADIAGACGQLKNSLNV